MAQPTATADQSGEVDVVIVGGGPAGLAAALALSRSRKSVLVLDAWPPRNAAATEVHGFVTQDGTPPAEIRRLGEQLAAYDQTTVRDDARVEAIRRIGPRLHVEARGQTGRTRTVCIRLRPNWWPVPSRRVSRRSSSC